MQNFCCCEMLRSVDRVLLTDVLGEHVSPKMLATTSVHCVTCQMS